MPLPANSTMVYIHETESNRRFMVSLDLDSTLNGNREKISETFLTTWNENVLNYNLRYYNYLGVNKGDVQLRNLRIDGGVYVKLIVDWPEDKKPAYNEDSSSDGTTAGTPSDGDMDPNEEGTTNKNRKRKLVTSDEDNDLVRKRARRDCTEDVEQFNHDAGHMVVGAAVQLETANILEIFSSDTNKRDVIFEDSQTVAFYKDSSPDSVHYVVVPKRRVNMLQNAEKTEFLGNLLIVATKVRETLK
ncbi:hypothetical protein GCK72_006716 [Caenorhabditis remanei]|uniref:HIT domain-containing protein n=1 Tax=Caenorhabditis remanei TaxID=31234 RepID=A0A6A5HG08_CAERE|nr:hypothetical protein GCK72_006716 [Caenorhabditis remanei]KAF1766758.1 hypothetical protein GCK72_006716 [Caenorhabditis remanei]